MTEGIIQQIFGKWIRLAKGYSLDMEDIEKMELELIAAIKSTITDNDLLPQSKAYYEFNKKTFLALLIGDDTK